MTGYNKIDVAGGDTAMTLNMQKRLQLLRRYIPSEAKTFLDCGCGAGAYVKAMQEELGLDSYGIEYLTDKVAQAHLDPFLKDRVLEGNIEDMPYENNQFDCLLLNEVIEHVPNEAAAMKEMYRVLKPGGLLFIFSPNRFYPFETHSVYLKDSKTVVPHTTPFIPWIPLALGKKVFDYWARNYWPWELKALSEEHGFEIQATEFLWQTFENISRNQPWLIAKTKPVLRMVANVLEKTPVLNQFGVSQVLVLKKPGEL